MASGKYTRNRLPVLCLQMHPLSYFINNIKGLTSRDFYGCEVICSQIHDMLHLALTLMFPFSDHGVKKRSFIRAHVAC